MLCLLWSCLVLQNRSSNRPATVVDILRYICLHVYNHIFIQSLKKGGEEKLHRAFTWIKSNILQLQYTTIRAVIRDCILC